jgi:DNA-binding NarL/FixJ family response regulator
VRSAVRLLVEQRLAAEVVGEVSSSEELLGEIGRLEPDVVLLDWDLPGTSKCDLLETIRHFRRRPPVLVLSTKQELMQEALDAGADAFVSKGDPPKRLLASIRALSEDARRE